MSSYIFSWVRAFQAEFPCQFLLRRIIWSLVSREEKEEKKGIIAGLGVLLENGLKRKLTKKRDEKFENIEINKNHS